MDTGCSAGTESPCRIFHALSTAMRPISRGCCAIEALITPSRMAATASSWASNPTTTRSPVLPAEATASTGIDLLERIENAPELILGNADTGIAHRKIKLDRIGRGGLQLDVQCHLAVIGELDCIRQQVDEDLAQVVRVAAHRKLHRLWGSYALLAATALVMLTGFAALIEMIYARQYGSVGDTNAHFLGLTLDTASAVPWLVAGAVAALGFVAFEAVRRRFAGGSVSSALLSWARDRVRELGLRYLRLDCEASRPPLKAIYERFGFRHHSDRQVGQYLVSRYEIDVR